MVNKTAAPALTQGKKPYTPPVVREFGNVRELTKTVGKTGNKDGGSGRTARSKV